MNSQARTPRADSHTRSPRWSRQPTTLQDYASLSNASKNIGTQENVMPNTESNLLPIQAQDSHRGSLIIDIPANELENSFHSNGPRSIQALKSPINSNQPLPAITFNLGKQSAFASLHPSRNNLDLSVKVEDEEQIRLENERMLKEQQELEELMKTKQIIEQIKASGSAVALRQVLRNFKDSKSVDKALMAMELQLLDDQIEDIDLGEVKDELLSVYDKTQKKTATRVLKFANEQEKKEKEKERRLVIQNSRGTDVKKFIFPAVNVFIA
mgnify:FL=1